MLSVTLYVDRSRVLSGHPAPTSPGHPTTDGGPIPRHPTHPLPVSLPPSPTHG